jgi:diadenosine tetraphosphate (Ap4A) HIT family hydrolase
MHACLICKRVDNIKKNKNIYFVKELTTGYVVLGDFQFYRGYSFFLSKIHVDELHELGSLRTVYLNEMAIVAEAVFNVFKPNKLNYELLGNTDRHLHWHIIPRYQNDPNPKAPIWSIDKGIRNAENRKPSKEELKILAGKLNQELNVLINAHLPEV